MRKKLTRLIFGGGALFLLFIGGFFLVIFSGIPSPELLENRSVAQSTKIYDRTGEILLYEIHGEEKRTVIPFAEIPEHITQAAIALEDQNFYTHHGFDIKGFLRGVIVQPLRGRGFQGGSTITQQLAKNAFLSPERTITRKIKELILAFRLEKQYAKDEILNLYLNQIPFGSNAYGIEAAAQTFLKKSAKDLSLAESALLISLPRAPSFYSPYGSHIDELMARRDFVLEQMHALGSITEEEKNTAQRYTYNDYQFAPVNSGVIKAAHFAIAIQEYLHDTYGEDFVRTAGLEVITTLDWNLQQTAERVVFEGAERNRDLYQGHNAALVAQDAKTGQLLALAGSKDYFAPAEPENCTSGVNCRFEGNFNVATQGLRQPGSAIKPFAYITAFQKGYTPDTVVFDLPTEFLPDNPNCPLLVDFTNEADDCYHPQNFDEQFRGPVTLRTALGQSINVPSVKTLYLAGIDAMLKLVRDFGITTLTERSRYGLSLVLGGGEIKLTELVGAYSVFAQDGIKRTQTSILKITDGKGRTLEEYKDDAIQVVEPQYARLINDVLSDVETRAGLFHNSLPLTTFADHEVALKTGTTNDYKDAWTMGYTPSLVVGVWAGNNDNTPMQQRGSSLLAAVPIWNAFMRETLPVMPSEAFIRPDPIFPDHPMNNGEYVVQYQAGNTAYPHIHNLLYYFNPQSAQYENWEEPVLTWAQVNVPNFAGAYNKPLPSGATVVQQGNAPIILQVQSPVNGSFITNNSVQLNAVVQSGSPIIKIESLLNGTLIATQPANGTAYHYQKTLSVPGNALQNKLTIIVYAQNGSTAQQEIILFRQ